MTEKELQFANDLLGQMKELKQEIKSMEDHLSMPNEKRSVDLIIFSEHQTRLNGKSLLNISGVDMKDLIITLDAGLVIPALNSLKNELKDLELKFESL